MRRRAVCIAAALGASRAPAQGDTSREDAAAWRAQVFATERAFARTMAERDHRAFVGFLSDEAVFFSARGPLRGKPAVADAWQRFFDGSDAPFSWEPDEVEVLASGTLAHSSGPVRDPSGKTVSRFHSVWRREAGGAWRIVFDRGERCDCATP